MLLKLKCSPMLGVLVPSLSGYMNFDKGLSSLKYAALYLILGFPLAKIYRK